MNGADRPAAGHAPFVVGADAGGGGHTGVRQPHAGAGTAQVDDAGPTAFRPALDERRIRPPALPDVLVARPTLHRRLGEAASKKLTVVAAPPGSGKTILLASWARTETERAIAWFTAAPGDDARAVATHLCAALSRVDGRPRHQIVDRVTPGGRELGASCIAAVVASAASLPATTLVLDDFHSLESHALGAEISTIIDLAPPQLHFVVAARADPPVAVHRFRLIDEFAELRADDLRFDAAATAGLVAQLAGRALTDAQASELTSRTGGWVTGLHLASSSLSEVDDIDAFIAGFAGDDELIDAYLTQQALDPMEPGLRDFLLQTSVLDLLSGSLCDAVTGRSDSEAKLERLSRTSLFIAAVDHRRTQFRCHPMLRDLLRSRLRAADPAGARERLHRAAAWYLDRDDIETAGECVVAIGDDDLIVAAAYAHGRALYRSGRVATVTRWLDRLSSKRRQEPDMTILDAGCRMLGGDVAEATSLLDGLRLSGRADEGEQLLIDLVTTWSSHHEPHTSRVVAASDRVLQRARSVPDSDLPAIAWLVDPRLIEKGCLLNRARAEVHAGSHDFARESVRAAARFAHGSSPLEISELALDAVMDAWDGELRSAEQQGKKAVGIASEAAVKSYPDTAVALLALARVSRQRARAARAQSFLDQAEDVLQLTRPPLLLAVLAAEAALLRLAQDDPRGGLDILAERRSAGPADAPPWVAEQVDLAEVRLMVALGDLEGAARRAALLPGATSETISVQILVAAECNDMDGARLLLDTWPDPPNQRSRLQQIFWQCILHDGDTADSVLVDRRMRELLSAAEDGGQVQLLFEAGTCGRRLLRERCAVAPTLFLQRLVDVPPPRARGAVARMPQSVEQLTDRELMVLRYLPTRLDNTEIAAELDVSVNTLKTHVKHIFRKFDVSSRRGAVEAAERFHLL